MIKKILLLALIFIIVYILAIFKSPQLASMVEDILGINGFNEFILGFKGTYDSTITNIPTKGEVIDAYGTAYSGAVEFKDKFQDGLDITKEKINGFRETMSGAEDTYNDLRDGYNEVKDFIDTNSGRIEEVKEVINTVSELTETLTNTGDIN